MRFDADDDMCTQSDLRPRKKPMPMAEATAAVPAASLRTVFFNRSFLEAASLWEALMLVSALASMVSVMLSSMMASLRLYAKLQAITCKINRACLCNSKCIRIKIVWEVRIMA